MSETEEQKPAAGAVHPDVLRILACPVPECRGRLEEQAEHLGCQSCGRRYPIHERWPVLIPEEADPPHEEKGES